LCQREKPCAELSGCARSFKSCGAPAGIQEKTSIYAGKIGDHVQLYGCPPLWSAPNEPIKERADQIKFQLNGGRMDLFDANGKGLYRNIWLHTVDVPKALQLVKIMATEYSGNTP
jgi:hypothetical protein